MRRRLGTIAAPRRDADAPDASVVDRLFPEHTQRVERAFTVLDEHEKRSLAEICRKLARRRARNPTRGCAGR